MDDIKKQSDTVIKEQQESTNNQTTRKPTTRKKPSDTVTKKSDTVTEKSDTVTIAKEPRANAQKERKLATAKKPSDTVTKKSDTVTKKSDTVTKQKMTNAERQRKHREKNINLSRLDMTISPETDEILNRLAIYHRVTKKELITKLAQDANQKIIDDMRKQEKKDKSFDSIKAIDNYIMLTAPKLF
jgi:sensor c-di-GMP phosphodiesterase-like protein